MSALVQQSSTTFFFGDNTAKSVSLTGVTAGNSIIVCASLYIYGGGTPTVSASDGTAYSTDVSHVISAGSDRPIAGIMRLHNVSSGSKTITVTIGGGISAGNCNGSIVAYEVSGLANAAPDKTATGGTTSTTPATGSTGTLTQANNFAIAALAATATGADLPSGWTNLITTDGRQDYKVLSSTSSISADWGTFNASGGWAGVLAVYKDASSVTVTDVDTDESITATQTNVVVTGTGFGSSQGAGSVTIRQGSTSVTQTIDSWAATSIQFDTVFDSGSPDLKHGSATLRVTENGGAYGELAITIAAISGRTYIDLGTPNTTSSYRISASSDLASGDQLEVRGLNGYDFPAGHTVNTDATVTLDSGVTGVAFEARAWSVADSTWGSWARQDIDPNPISVAPPAGALTLSGKVPNVTASALQRVEVPVGTLTLSGHAPTVAITTGTQTVVPAVVGLTRTAAQAAIEAAGLVEQAFFYYDDADLNEVVAQSPAAGTVVNEDTNVEIRVSVGTETTASRRVGRTKFRVARSRTVFRVA